MMEIRVTLREKKYITSREAAGSLGYHPDYISYLIRTGKVRGKRIPAKVFWQVKPEEILDYCKKNKGFNGSPIKFKNFGQKDSAIIRKRYISLKEASQISGYHPDYIGYLVRSGKISGRKVSSGIAWLTTKEDLVRYKSLNKEKSLEKEVRKPLIRDIFIGKNLKI